MVHCRCEKGGGACRCIGAIVSALYNALSGVFFIFMGIATILFWGLGLDVLNRLTGTNIIITIPGFAPIVTSVPPGLTIPIILLGLVIVLFGMANLIAAYGLICLRNWARIMAIGLQGAMALIALIWFVLLVGTGWLGASLLCLFLFIVNIALIVVLLLRSTVICFSASVCCGSGKVAKCADPCPPQPCPPQPCPPQPAPCQPYPAPCHPHAATPRPADMATPVGVAPTQFATPGGPADVAPTEVGLTEPATLAWLVELSGPRSGRQHRLRPQLTLGRNPHCCDVVLDDGKISGSHARVRLEQGQFVLYDLASTNHTYVNDQEVIKQPLQDGDKIRLGPSTLLGFMRVGA